MKKPFRQTKRATFAPAFNGGTLDAVMAPTTAQGERGQETMRIRRERLASDPEYRAQQRLKVMFGGARRSKKKIRMPVFGGSDGSS